MSLIWHRRAALNTPWDPLANLDPLLYLDGDYVEITGAGVSKWLDRARSGDAGRVPVMAVDANRAPHTAANASFRGHGSIAFPAGKRLVSGTWSAAIPQPTTDYYVVKLPVLSTAQFTIIDGQVGKRRAVSIANKQLIGYDGVGSSLAYVGPMTDNLVAVICVVHNAASSAIYVNNMTTPVASGTLGTDAPTSIAIGCTVDTINPFVGDCGLIGIYPGLHAADVRKRAGSWFGDKYGVTIT